MTSVGVDEFYAGVPANQHACCCFTLLSRQMALPTCAYSIFSHSDRHKTGNKGACSNLITYLLVQLYILVSNIAVLFYWHQC